MLGFELLEKKLNNMRKRQIYKEIQEYIRWKEPLSEIEYVTDNDYLLLFVEKAKDIRKISDITLEHIEVFCNEMNSRYQSTCCIKAVRCFLRYHKARGRVCIDPRTIRLSNENRGHY